MSTIYEAVGGHEALLRLAEAWHRRCLDDPLVAHAFPDRLRSDHVERLAAYWAEQLGGPADYTAAMGGHTHAVRLHTGNGPHEQMDGKAIAAFVLALDDAAIPRDPRLWHALIAWFGWATALLNHRWSSVEDVPEDLPMPTWDWDGTEGW